MIIRVVIVIVVVLLGVISDYRQFKIPNWLIVFGIVAALIINLMQAIVGIDICKYILGFIIPFAILFPMYAIGGIGAGDVKLLCVIGGLVGRSSVEMIIVISMIVAGILCVMNLLKSLITGKADITTAYLFGKAYKGLHKMHFSLAILVGTIVVIGTNGGY